MQAEIEKTIHDIQAVRGVGDLCFVTLSDTRLLDSGEQTRERIRNLDRELHFDFLVHLGDILIGGCPQKVSRRILREEVFHGDIKEECIACIDLTVRFLSDCYFSGCVWVDTFVLLTLQLKSCIFISKGRCCYAVC